MTSITEYLHQYEKQLKRKRKSPDKSVRDKEKRIETLIQLIEDKEEQFKSTSYLFAKTIKDRDRKMHENMLDEISDSLDKMEKEVNKLKEEIMFYVPGDNSERLKNFEEFKENFDVNNIDYETANRLLKSIIQKIYYIKENDEVRLRIIPR